MLIVAVVVGAFFTTHVLRQRRYGQTSYRISQKIHSLIARRPPHVPPDLWEDCVGWAVTAHGNICYSEGHTPYSSMCEFEQDLDEKLAGPIDLDTLRWIGERAAATGPRGEHYMRKVGWREQWKNLISVPRK